jgi:hypothetical protein
VSRASQDRSAHSPVLEDRPAPGAAPPARSSRAFLTHTSPTSTPLVTSGGDPSRTHGPRDSATPVTGVTCPENCGRTHIRESDAARGPPAGYPTGSRTQAQLARPLTVHRGHGVVPWPTTRYCRASIASGGQAGAAVSATVGDGSGERVRAGADAVTCSSVTGSSRLPRCRRGDGLQTHRGRRGPLARSTQPTWSPWSALARGSRTGSSSNDPTTQEVISKAA